MIEKRQEAAAAIHLLVILNALMLLCGGAAGGQSTDTNPASVVQKQINLRVGADGLPAHIEAMQGPAGEFFDFLDSFNP